MNQQKQIEAEVRELQQQGIGDEAIAAYVKMRYGSSNNETPMSRTDGINMITRDRDVPGAYVDQYQKSMDAYGAHMMQQELAAERTEALSMMNGTLPINPYQGNPNVRVETEGQRTTIGPNGQLIIY